LLSRYIDLLLDANARMNLTRITDRAAAEVSATSGDALTALLSSRANRTAWPTSAAAAACRESAGDRPAGCASDAHRIDEKESLVSPRDDRIARA